MADWSGDLCRREDAGRDLIQQRLKQMVVRPIDEGDPHGRWLERACGGEAAESAADDDDVRRSFDRRASRARERLLRGCGLRADRDVEVQGRVPDVARPAPPLDGPRPRLRDVEVHRHDRVHVTVADRAVARALLRVQARLAAAGPALEEYGADEQVTGDIGRQLDPASEKGSAISARLVS